MFDEKEPGKPKNWGWTIGIIIVICTINLAIFIIIRVMLDSENEFSEPLVQGEFRENLTKFLGIFALSFSFGCWCCFCCMGNCFKWATFCFHEQAKNDFSNCWSSYLKHQHNVVEQVQIKSSNIFATNRRDKINVQENDHLELAKTRSLNAEDCKSDPKTYEKFDVDEQDDDNFNIDKPTHTRPKHINIHPHLHSERKSNQWMEIHKPPINKSAFETRHNLRHQRDYRRHSVATSSSRMTGGIGVHNVHYYEVPVSLIAPGAVAIVDPAFNGTDSDDSSSLTNATVVSPAVSPTSPSTLSPTKREEVIIDKIVEKLV